MREVHQNLEVGWTNLSREIELTESVEKSGVREQEREIDVCYKELAQGTEGPGGAVSASRLAVRGQEVR